MERLGELQRQSGERGQERKELEERTKALQKQLANAKVSRWCLISFVTRPRFTSSENGLQRQV